LCQECFAQVLAKDLCIWSLEKIYMMQPLEDLESFEKYAQAFDQAVLQTSDISPVCSASDWLYAAHTELHPKREYLFTENDGHWLALSYGPFSSFEQTFYPLEFSWGFGCPLVGPDPEVSVDLLLSTLIKSTGQWQVALLSGIPVASPLWFILQREIGKYYGLDTFQGADCAQVDLSEGAEAFLERRSSKFRSNVRSSVRKAQKRGVSFDWFDQICDAEELFQRILAVEQMTWKHNQGGSIFLVERYHRFYKTLIQRMAKKGDLRALLLRMDGQDVAYIVGGVLGQVYRGFQLGYNDEYARLGLGHVAQWEMIRRLAQEGIHTYDLGMVMDYKRRWSDKILKLENIVVFARG